MMYPIFISELSKSFIGNFGKRVDALHSLSLAVKEGEVFGFLGPNGAGKSTTIKTLMGQIAPTHGVVQLFDQSVTIPAARRRVGYLPENPSFYDFLTAQEYLQLVGRVFGMSAKSIHRESTRVLELLSLSDAAKRPIKGYSKGMVQRLGIAQALLHNPDLYIFDEPMSGLDPVGRSLVKQIMVELKRNGKTIFFSTHVTADVEAVCDRVGVVVEGSLRALNPVEEIMEQGLEGYWVQMSANACELLPEFSPYEKSKGVAEAFVPHQCLNDFMARVKEAEIQVRLIEPKRKNLEAFFLDIVNKSESCL